MFSCSFTCSSLQLRNTLKFLLGNLQGFDPRSQAVDPKQMHYIDQYMLHLLREFSMKVRLNVNTLNHGFQVKLGWASDDITL